MRHTLDLDFFGILVRITVPDQADADHFRYYFKNFVSEDREITPAIELRFTIDRPGSFVKALLSPDILKEISVREQAGDWLKYDAFTSKSTAPSPLPPFFFPAFRQRFSFAHAASVVDPLSGDGLLLAGKSLSGKSVMSLEMLRRGWRFLSDDYSILERDTGLLHGFSRPLGIRSNSLRLLPWLDPMLRDLEPVVRIETPSGLTTMVRIEQLFPGALRRKAPLRRIILMDNQPHHEPAPYPRLVSLECSLADAGLFQGVTPDLPDIPIGRLELSLDQQVAAVADEIMRFAQR